MCFISDQFSSFGCLSEMISLSCEGNKSIFVHSAYFGQYFISCSNGCCSPHPARDCVESVEDNQIEVGLFCILLKVWFKAYAVILVYKIKATYRTSAFVGIVTNIHFWTFFNRKMKSKWTNNYVCYYNYLKKSFKIFAINQTLYANTFDEWAVSFNQ